MHISRHDIPVRFEVPGITVRQVPEFGSSTGSGYMAGEFFSLAAGTDTTPVLRGLADDACQAPHWGHLISGHIVVDYTDGSTDDCKVGDIFYWPPGHNVRVTDDADVILFSPTLEHGQVLDHMLEQIQQA